MCTEEHRRIYRREGNGYPTDLRDAEWARLAPLIPETSLGWRPRKTDMRGDERPLLFAAHWQPLRYLPRDSFPPRSTVYNIFRKFRRDDVWGAIWAELHMALRERMGRDASPSRGCGSRQPISQVGGKGGSKDN